MDIDELKRRKLEEMKMRSDAIEDKLKGVKYKIGVYSGKGGVGKTTVAVNLAAALARQGKRVGFLDADIDCPNAHVLFGIKEKTEMRDGVVIPVEKHGVQVVSMAMLIDDGAVMWRGPMISKAIGDLLAMSKWDYIDYLIIDMPPGTSDAPITLMQMLPSMKFIGVTTPQSLSQADLNRSISMMGTMNMQLIGVVENMCSDVFGCSGKDYIAHVPLFKGDGIGVLHDKKLAEIYGNIINATEKSWKSV